jgi:hypothetical protein
MTHDQHERIENSLRSAPLMPRRSAPATAASASTSMVRTERWSSSSRTASRSTSRVAEQEMTCRLLRSHDLIISGSTIVLAGRLGRLSKDEARHGLEALGAKVTVSVPAKTDLVFAGRSRGQGGSGGGARHSDLRRGRAGGRARRSGSRHFAAVPAVQCRPGRATARLRAAGALEYNTNATGVWDPFGTAREPIADARVLFVHQRSPSPSAQGVA